MSFLRDIVDWYDFELKRKLRSKSKDAGWCQGIMMDNPSRKHNVSLSGSGCLVNPDDIQVTFLKRVDEQGQSADVGAFNGVVGMEICEARKGR